MYSLNREDPIIEIEYAKKLYNAQVEKVKEETYIRNLLKINYVNQIKANMTRYDVACDILRKAHGQVDEKLKKNRKELETIKDFIIDDFLSGNRDFKLKNIICCGYDNYAWAIQFEGYGQIFQIVIPMRKNLSVDNIESAYNGMFAFSIEKSNGIWNLLKTSYKIKDIAEFISEYFQLDKVNEDEY